jgi:4-amino-4-deoxy-L-arabinose transferase-like glycosyltransferase
VATTIELSLRAWKDRRTLVVIVLLAVALLYPIVLCAAAFPTPYIDLLEMRNWGLAFPLYTWKHPPLQAWVNGIVALTGAHDAWLFMVLGQACNLLTLFYVVRIAREFIAIDLGAALVILVGGNVYLSAALPTIALNADQLQAPLWAGLIYHALRAVRDNRWRDWILLGVMLSLAFLTKYFVLLLVLALVVAAVLVPAYRRMFANARFYVAGLVALLIVLPYLIALTRHHEAFSYGMVVFSEHASRLKALYNLVHPVVVTILPIGIVAIWLYPRGLIRIERGLDPHLRLLLIAGAVLVILQVALILIGLEYSARYTYPFLALSACLCLAVVRIEPRGLAHLAGFLLAAWAAIVPGTAIYAFTVLRPPLREPHPAAAAAIAQQWHRQFKCGPAYIIGMKDAAFGVAFYFRRSAGPVLGVSTEDYLFHAQWINRDLIRKEGAIIVAYWQNQLLQWFARDFPQRSAPMTLSLPYRRTASDARQTYTFSFVAPAGC